MSSGRCNCGKFQFEAPSPQGVAACFCKCCIRGGGSLCSMNAVIPVDGLKFTKGSQKELNVYQDNETSSGNPMARYFCGSCGSPIQSVPQDSPVAYFKLSALDDPESYTSHNPPNMAIFTAEAPAWAKGAGKSDDGTKGLQWPQGDQIKYFSGGPA
ncbi:unnamed protein product [Sympodiomycopsis kandeliae]